MEINRTKFIRLSESELQLAQLMIKEHEMRSPGTKSKVHQSLASKVIFSLLNRRLPGIQIHYTDAEKQLLRQYNQEFCELLALELPTADKWEEVAIMAAYYSATNIQLLFSPRR